MELLPRRSVLMICVMMKSVLFALLSFAAFAQQATVAPAAGVLGKGAVTLYGPVLSAAVEVKSIDDSEKLALRGVLFRTTEPRCLSKSPALFT